MANKNQKNQAKCRSEVLPPCAACPDYKRVLADALRVADGAPIGVSWSFVQTFVASLPKDAINTKTTTDLCNEYVIPRTKAAESAYIELPEFQSESKMYFGRATVFVSHAWKYMFCDPLSVMEEYEAQHPGTFFWFDLFINNQNCAASLPREWWSTTFKDSIRLIGAVVVVMAPWDTPVPVTRAWCLWEIMCALTQDGVLFIARFPPAQRLAFRSAVRDDWERVAAALPRVDVERAEAFKASDREFILATVAGTIGFAAVNERVRGIMQTWMIAAVEDAIGDMRRAASHDKLHLDVSGSDPFYDHAYNVFRAWGDRDRAQRLRDPIRALESENRFLHDTRGDAEQAVSRTACDLSRQGEHERAISLLRALAVHREACEGMDSVHTLVALHNLGLALYYARKIPAATECFMVAIIGMQRVLPDADRSEVVGTALVNFSNVMVAADYSGMRALAVLQEALKVFTALRGEDAPYCQFLSKAINTLSIFS